MGLTQNQNESINGILWKMIPKSRFCGKTRVQTAVGKTVIHFNSGSTTKAYVYELMGVDLGENFFANTQAIDKERISSAERKVSDKERLARKERRARRKKYITDDAVINYKAGDFGLSKEPENLEGDMIEQTVEGSKKPPKKKNKVKTCKTAANDIYFDIPSDDIPSSEIPLRFVDDSEVPSSVLID